jgi:hypothetical protein
LNGRATQAALPHGQADSQLTSAVRLASANALDGLIIGNQLACVESERIFRKSDRIEGDGMDAKVLMSFIFENPTGRFWVGLGCIAIGFAIIAYEVAIWWKVRAAAHRKSLDRRDQFRDRN